MAKAYGMTAEQFQEEVAASMAIMGVELIDQDKAEAAEWSVDVGERKVKITVEVSA